MSHYNGGNGHAAGVSAAAKRSIKKGFTPPVEVAELTSTEKTLQAAKVMQCSPATVGATSRIPDPASDLLSAVAKIDKEIIVAGIFVGETPSLPGKPDAGGTPTIAEPVPVTSDKADISIERELKKQKQQAEFERACRKAFTEKYHDPAKRLSSLVLETIAGIKAGHGLQMSCLPVAYDLPHLRLNINLPDKIVSRQRPAADWQWRLDRINFDHALALVFDVADSGAVSMVIHGSPAFAGDNQAMVPGLYRPLHKLAFQSKTAVQRFKLSAGMGIWEPTTAKPDIAVRYAIAPIVGGLLDISRKQLEQLQALSTKPEQAAADLAPLLARRPVGFNGYPPDIYNRPSANA